MKWFAHSLNESDRNIAKFQKYGTVVERLAFVCAGTAITKPRFRDEQLENFSKKGL